MSTGVAEVDEQHKALIATINRLGEAMQAGEAPQEIAKILNFAGKYAQEHFRTEEAYFRHYNCPLYDKNKEEHAHFVERFVELVKEFQSKGADVKFIHAVYKELSDWLLNHILGTDSQLRPYVKNKAEV